MEGILLFLAFIAGAVISFIYFGGLWLTTQQVVKKQGATGLIIMSFLVRMGIALSGFYLILMVSNWKGFVVCFAGFFLTRLLLLRRWSPEVKHI